MVQICSKSLFEIIQEQVFLKAPNHSGWYGVKCQVCSDHSYRAAFRSGQGVTSYHCFNCKAAFVYEEESGKLSKNARKVLGSFGISKDNLQQLKSPFLEKAREKDVVDLSSLKELRLDTPPVALPKHSFPIGYCEDEELQLPLAEYLLSRKVDPVAINAHFSFDPKLSDYVIIPYFRNGKIIYWQARSTKADKKRWLNSVNPRDSVIYGFDVVYNYDDAPLFVTEGLFDAISLNGVCILGSSLNDAKIELLKRSKRRIIFVIDRDKSGEELGKQVIENGWELSFVDKRANDANDSVIKFGTPYTIYMLLKNATRTLTTDSSRALLNLGVLEARLGKFK